MGKNEDKKRTVDARIQRIRDRLKTDHGDPANTLRTALLGILDLLSDELR